MFGVFAGGEHLFDVNATSIAEAYRIAGEHMHSSPIHDWMGFKLDPKTGYIV
jgi:hypothetical protein